jgi:hypothetical protein
MNDCLQATTTPLLLIRVWWVHRSTSSIDLLCVHLTLYAQYAFNSYSLLDEPQSTVILRSAPKAELFLIIRSHSLLFSIVYSSKNIVVNHLIVNMRSSILSVALPFALLNASLATAQQYEGDVVSANLPTVENAEINFFKIRDPSSGSESLSLINYYSLGTEGKHIEENKIKRAVISIHGLLRDPWNYENDVR